MEYIGVVVTDEPKKKRKPQFMNGIMHKLIVYENGAMIGYGYVIRYSDGDTSLPDLFDIRGERLPEGWYQLQVQKESYTVVVPKNVQ